MIILTNSGIKEKLKEHRKVSDFSRFVGISVQAMYKRLNSQKLKDNLYGAFLLYWVNR